MMLFKPKNPQKYNEMSKTELVAHAVRKDNAEIADKWMTAERGAKLLRLGSDFGASLMIGVLRTKWPWLDAIAGTSASIDHLVAVGFGIAAYASDDDDVANASEGICHAGLGPLGQSLGRSIGAMLP